MWKRIVAHKDQGNWPSYRPGRTPTTLTTAPKLACEQAGVHLPPKKRCSCVFIKPESQPLAPHERPFSPQRPNNCGQLRNALLLR